MPPDPRPLVVAVAGPTASGKSALGIALAQRFDGEVISCDAMQVYAGFDIGTAKTAIAERGGVAHHLIDICTPDEAFNAGSYAALARASIHDVAQRGRLPLVVGGTGFYLEALLEGLFDGPGRRPELRTRLMRKEGQRPGHAHRILQRLDPAAAARIHPNDVSKTIRAVEVCLASGAPMSQRFGEGRLPLGGYRILRLILDPPREDLYQRINQRCEEMFRDGLVDEVARLLSAGVSSEAQAFLAVGYREAIAVIDGRMTRAEAILATQQATRRYAKRQTTWFRREKDRVLLSGFGDEAAIFHAAATHVGEALNFRGELSPNERNIF